MPIYVAIKADQSGFVIGKKIVDKNIDNCYMINGDTGEKEKIIYSTITRVDD